MSEQVLLYIDRAQFIYVFPNFDLTTQCLELFFSNEVEWSGILTSTGVFPICELSTQYIEFCIGVVSSQILTLNEAS